VRSDIAHGTGTLRRRHVYRRDVSNARRREETGAFTEFVIKISFFFFLILLSGLFLKTRDFLQPLDREDKGGEAADGGSVPAERNACSISHVGGGQGAEKPEGSALWALPTGLQTKPEPDYGSRSISTSYGSHAGGVSYTLWDDNDTASRGQWPPPSLAALVATKHTSAPEKKQFMKAAATSGSSRGYEVADEEEAAAVDLTVYYGIPKLLCRFQILRELIPHSDQKRDKASFLLEVQCTYRTLQECSSMSRLAMMINLGKRAKRPAATAPIKVMRTLLNRKILHLFFNHLKDAKPRTANTSFSVMTFYIVLRLSSSDYCILCIQELH
ncbi:hypothetical protein B296_00009031, partial [Ensete ventricosum]